MYKQEIHISDMTTFKSCRRLWYFSSLLQRGLEPNVPYAPFFSGRAIHYCLERYYGELTPPLVEAMQGYLQTFLDKEMKDVAGMDLWAMEETMFEEQVELISGMLDHYVLWVNSNHNQLWSDDNLEFISLETEFSVPLLTPRGNRSNRVFLAGRFDGLVRRRDNGTYWIWETKTAASPKRLQATLDNNEQSGAYVYAAQQLIGENISGVLYNILRKKVPAAPRVLKSGALSQAQDQDTTPALYLQAIKDNHPGLADDPQWIMDNYGPFLQTLMDRQSEKPFFLRIPIRRTSQEVQGLSQRIWQVALEMTRSSTALYTNASWGTCGNCRFKGPCLAWEAGADVDSILSREYRPRRRWDPLVGQDLEEPEHEYTNGSH